MSDTCGKQLLRAACCVAIAMVLWAGQVRAGEVYVFGDSLSDTGNLFTLTGGTSSEYFTTDPSKSPRFPTPPYYNGRASNGLLWVETFASQLGMNVPQPAALGGTNYAFIGAVTGPGSSSSYPIPTIQDQVDLYLTGASAAASDDLYVIWGGANDFLFGQTDASVPVNNIAGAIESLHSSVNATRFVVLNLPPLGKTPTGAAADPAGLDLLSDQFNTQLHTELDGLRSALGVSLYEVDINAQFEQLFADPAAYGLTNVTDSVLEIDEDPSSLLFGYPVYPYDLVNDPDTSLFFDGVHPTALGHALIGEVAAASVPEPSTWVLFAAGVACLAWAGRRSRRRSAS